MKASKVRSHDPSSFRSRGQVDPRSGRGRTILRGVTPLESISYEVTRLLGSRAAFGRHQGVLPTSHFARHHWPTWKEGQAAPRRRPQPFSRILTAWRDCMKSNRRSADGGSSVARNTKIEPSEAVFCAWWGNASKPIRSFHTVSEGVFSELRPNAVLGSSAWALHTSVFVRSPYRGMRRAEVDG